MTELYIDLIDSNEAMMVLNNLPNVQLLNGKNTKDDDDDEEFEDIEEEGEAEVELEENNEFGQKENIKNENIKIYNNEINNRNNNHHLYPKMEKIEEDKNSNYVSENNKELNENKIKDININIHDDKIDDEEKIKEINLKEKEIRNKLNDLNGKNNDINIDGGIKHNIILYDKITSDNNNKVLNLNDDIKSNDNKNLINNKEKIEKEKESNIDLNDNSLNEEKKTFAIDITNEELNSLKENKYNENSDFVAFMKEFCDSLNKNEANSDGERLQNNFIEKLKSIEAKKVGIPNYYYFYLLYKKKLNIIKNMLNEVVPYIINKCPELNILERLINQLFSTIKDSKELFTTLHSHIEGFKEKKNNDNKINEIFKEKDNKISDLEKLKIKLLKSIEDNKAEYEKKIYNLEKENKIMTERLINKANTMINSTINDTQAAIISSDRLKKITTMSNNINKTGTKKSNNYNNNKYALNNETLNTNFSNQYILTNKSKSPMKTNEFNNTFENNMINNQFNTNYQMNINSTRQQLISLKTLKDFINELYVSKFQYDIKCAKFKLPKETLEEYMYTFLNKKYGLKSLIIEWAKNIINGIKYYSKKDSFVLLFGKIMRNEQEEDARFIIKKVSESIEELLLYYIKRQNPLKLVNEIKKIFEKKKKSKLFEEEWKGIIYSIYEKEEAKEIENKIINFINKEIQRKKIEMFKKYKNSRINNKNKYNNNIENNYLNTINSLNNCQNNKYMNTIGNFNGNNKLSRGEKYNMLLLAEDKVILYDDFIKIVLDNHIRFRDKQLKNFVELFKSVDTDKDGVINEEQFSELIQKMKIFKEKEVENKIFHFSEKIDPFDYQKFTFSECISFFSSEMIKEKDGNENEISILEKVCLNEEKNNNDVKENEDYEEKKQKENETIINE